MKILSQLFSVLSLVFILCSPGLAASVATFTSVEGRVDVTAEGGGAVPAHPGDSLNESDIVRTKSDGRAEIEFIDGTVLHIAPGTRFEIASYQVSEDRQEGVLNLFRGKIRSMVSKFLGPKEQKKFEIKTRTAVLGVRGTDFFTYYQQGVSGAVFKEGEGYVYPIDNPDDRSIVKKGQAMLMKPFETLPEIRTVTDFEIHQHTKDTSERPSGGSRKDAAPPSYEAALQKRGKFQTGRAGGLSGGRGNSPGGMLSMNDMQVDERILFEEFSYTIDIASFDGDDYFYGINTDNSGQTGISIPGTDETASVFISLPITGDAADNPSDHIINTWELYVGNTPGYFQVGDAEGGSIFASPVAADNTFIAGQSWQIANLYFSGTYSPFDESVLYQTDQPDQWALNLDYQQADTFRYFSFTGEQWSAGQIKARGTDAWVNWQECLTGVGGGTVSGTFDAGSGTWKATGRWVNLETDLFLEMAADRKNDLEALNIPCVEIGRADLMGTGNNMNVAMRDVTFFTYSAGGDPALWASGNIAGTYTDTPEIGQPVTLSGSGLTADFSVRSWDEGRWSALVENGSGTLSRTDKEGNTAVRFQGGAAGIYTSDDKTFSGTGAGIAGK